MKKIIVLTITAVILLLFISCDRINNPEYNVDKSSCNSCGSCLSICPRDAVDIGQDGKAIIDQTKCNQCGKCIAICPQQAIF
ncbi:MAG: 4Fe-4S binding protein [Candidatus Cloacimonetes bacterium]|nr:4Fe-4S binding protein [Candidatus Cloacimonadota bacterium]